MLEPIPGLTCLRALVPQPPPAPTAVPTTKIPERVQATCRNLVAVALKAYFGLIDARHLSPAIFAPPVARTIRAAQRGNGPKGAVEIQSLHLRERSQRIDAIGCATLASNDGHNFGYMATIAADENSTLGLQMRTFRVL